MGFQFPKWLKTQNNLSHIDISNSGISQSIPTWFKNFSTHLSLVNISNNQINGPIAINDYSATRVLEIVDLSSNHFYGSVPNSLFKVGALFLSKNNFSSLSYICNVSDEYYLRILDISDNQLTGELPNCFLKLKDLRALILSNNKLSGEIPGFIGQLLAFPIGFFLIILFKKAKKRLFKTRQVQQTNQASKNGDILSIWNYDGKIAFEDIIKATEDFDIRYCIGTGGYGSVYRAQLPSGKIVALKKLHNSEAEKLSFRKSFENEVETLTKIRHRNIIRLYGFCLSKQSMFLIYEYMERGSLFSVLSNDLEVVELDWCKRINIIKGIACALSYMHYDCTPPIVHRDITTTNILLNSEFEAFVSDYGTARLLDPDSSNQTMIS
ncbi:hypothetical protein G4B88_023194, partial [Cannabis sativa]